tara:strand:- start:1998 stop:3752 length:1755 start_codon:yes stop_codon:yes gene_type:complete
LKELKYLNKYLLKYRKRLVLGFFIVIVARILLLFTPGLIRNSVNVVELYLNGEITSIDDVQYELVKNIFLILLASISAGIFTFLTRQTIINVSRFVEFDLKNEIFNQYQNLSMNFYKKNRTGDLMSRISEDVSKVRMYVGPAIMYSVNTFTLIAITLFYMIRQSPELTLYTISPLPILSFAIFKISRKINLKSKVVQESISKLSSFSQEIFSAIKIIKSYAIEETTKKKFNKISNLTKDNQIELVRIQAMFFPLMIFLIGISNLFVIYIGGSKYLDGSIQQLGIIAEFIIYVNMLTWPVASLGWISSVIQQAEASQKRINEFLKQKNDIIQHENTLKNISGKIKVKNLYFEYADSRIKALKNINLNLEAGKSLGIIGSTGSGKTSLIDIILRTLDFNNGEVLIDDLSIKKFNILKLRTQIGIVNQDSFLFSDSISNNIRFGSKKADTKKIVEVSKICGIHQEIMDFNDQYNTLLGERGVNLSGGQKQRLCIARALIKNPKILILDDCLSALDNKTENEILSKIKKTYSNISKIIVSHRVSSILDCDNIIVMHNGEIIQRGEHNNLINIDGYYKSLFLDQSNKKD